MATYLGARRAHELVAMYGRKSPGICSPNRDTNRPWHRQPNPPRLPYPYSLYDIEQSLTWRSTHGQTIRTKAILDMRPTNPQIDILPTGECEAYIREVYIMIPSTKSSTTTPTSPPDLEQPISAENQANLPSRIHS